MVIVCCGLWLCGCVVVWLCGCVVVWLCGCCCLLWFFVVRFKALTLRTGLGHQEIYPD